MSGAGFKLVTTVLSTPSGNVLLSLLTLGGGGNPTVV